MESLEKEIKNLKAQLVETEAVIDFSYHNEEMDILECLKLIQIVAREYQAKYKKGGA